MSSVQQVVIAQCVLNMLAQIAAALEIIAENGGEDVGVSRPDTRQRIENRAAFHLEALNRMVDAVKART